MNLLLHRLLGIDKYSYSNTNLYKFLFKNQF